MTTLLVALVAIGSLAAADVTGRWTFDMTDFSGHPRTFDCTFRQEGTKLTGECGGESERVRITGTVKESKVDFQHQTGRNNEITAHYSGELNEAGTTLKGKWRVMNPDSGKEMSADFTAVRR